MEAKSYKTVTIKAWQDTIMTDEEMTELIRDYYDPGDFCTFYPDRDPFEAVAEEQAKLTWDIAFKAGEKKVVEFVNRVCQSDASSMSWNFRQRWLGFLKSEGIE